MSADALVDIASLDSAAAAVETAVETPVEETTVETPVVETPAEETPVETPAEETETQTHNADGTEKTPEQQAEFKKTAAAKTASDKALESTPANVRSVLKSLRDSDPKNAAVVKELHGSFERWNAAKQIFPKGVAEMQEAKAFIDSVGGPDGYQKMQDMINTVTATDELLYAADPKLWDNVIEDLKANNHPEALGQLAPSFLAKLKAHDAKAYYDSFQPHFFEGLKECNIQGFVTKFNEALSAKNDKGEVTPDIKTITGLVKGISDWFKGQEDEAKSKSTTPVDTPERKKFLAEKAAFEKTKTEDGVKQQKAYENSVAEDCEKKNNNILGKALGVFLKMPFFKDFQYESKVDLGNGIKDRLYAALKADKTYQTQMNALWKQPRTDANKAKMVQYHEAKLQTIATDIVTKTVQTRYPGYAKGGSAAGKAAAAVVKKADATKAAATSVTSGKPIYVASRPTDLVRDPIKVNGKDYSSSDLATLQILGRGFVKTPDGKGHKFITWRK
jgi:hypothetical protein